LRANGLLPCRVNLVDVSQIAAGRNATHSGSRAAWRGSVRFLESDDELLRVRSTAVVQSLRGRSQGEHAAGSPPAVVVKAV